MLLVAGSQSNSLVPSLAAGGVTALVTVMSLVTTLQIHSAVTTGSSHWRFCGSGKNVRPLPD